MFGNFIQRDRCARSQRGSIIVLVMVVLLFAAAALVAFLDRASTDLMVDARAAQAARLRPDAYSALEVTLAVLEDFVRVDNGLRVPAEGWGDPLTWAGWSPSDPGRTVTVSFEDESGKIPLIHANATTLMNLFQSDSWNDMTQADAQKLTDAILTWMQQNYVPVGTFQPDYEQSALPYDPPQRSMRSFSELAAIDVVRDTFFDANDRPNALWWKFCSDFSVFNFRGANLNGANADVLTAVGQFSTQQLQSISQYLNGTSETSTLGRQWFTNAADLQAAVGRAGNLNAFVFTIRALRINITVNEGQQIYRLSAVVAPQGGATTVLTTATDVRTAASNSANGTSGETASSTSTTATSGPTAAPTSAQTAAAAANNIQFPFTILEIRENDEILTPPPEPPLSPDGTPSASPAASPMVTPASS